MNGEPVVFMVDDVMVEALPGESVLDAAKRYDIDIPHLCHSPGMRPDGNCRACVVEIDGERVLAASCCRHPVAGMRVSTTSKRVEKSQRMVLELLLGDVAQPPHDPESRLAHWAKQRGLGTSRYAQRAQPGPDFTYAGIEVRLDACIQCKLCIRACREVQVNDVIGYAYRGSNARIVFDLDDPMGESTCVGCGECVQACPTGALLASLPTAVAKQLVQSAPEPPKQQRPAPPVPRGGVSRGGMYDAVLMGAAYTAQQPQDDAATEPGDTAASGPTAAVCMKPTSNTESLCPHCGVGCQVTYHVADNHILRVSGRDGPSNRGRLCAMGRFGFDYVRDPQRLLKPLIRREGVAKDARRLVDPSNPLVVFREADWDEALDAAAAGLRRIRDSLGPWMLAGLGSATVSNEEAYLFQKLVRAGLGTNNVDHCTRLRHASSDAAWMECLNSSAASNQVADVQHADCFIVIGADPTVSHPVAATFMKNAIERGAKLILMDTRRTELARHAMHHLQFNHDTDVALLNAMLHTIVQEDLVDRTFIDARTTGFDDLVAHIEAYSPESMQYVCGIPAEQIRAASRLYATSRASMIFRETGNRETGNRETGRSRCLIALALITGQIGRRGAGLHLLRDQSNTQGAADMGLAPTFYPDYRSVEDAEARESFANLWNARVLDRRKGLAVAGMMNAVRKREIRGMYVMGDNPAKSDAKMSDAKMSDAKMSDAKMSDADVQHAREALAMLDWLVVQDFFFTETASFADVILPASAFPEKTGTFTSADRRVQIGRAALDPPGDVRQDLDLIQQMAQRLGLDWNYRGPADVWSEIRKAVPSCAGITWERLEDEHGVTYPCRNEGDPGDGILFADRCPTEDGRARIVPAGIAVNATAAGSVVPDTPAEAAPGASP